MKTLKYKKDFEIIQRPAVTEYFVWNCKKCKEENKTSEYSNNYKMENSTLTCSKCSSVFKYEF